MIQLQHTNCYYLDCEIIDGKKEYYICEWTLDDSEVLDAVSVETYPILECRDTTTRYSVYVEGLTIAEAFAKGVKLIEDVIEVFKTSDNNSILP